MICWVTRTILWFAAIFIGKQVFGGVGGYPMHPVAVGWLVLLLSWPNHIYAVDAASIASAHPLGIVATALGGIALCAFGVVRWQLPTAVLLGVFVSSLVLSPWLSAGVVDQFLTGHVVLATLHTNDAPGAVARLQDMNIESYLISSALNGVVAQRLIRTLCQHCETKYFPSEDVLFDAELTEHSGRSFRKGEGCKKCHDTGFKGRMGVYEVLEVTPAELLDHVRRGELAHSMHLGHLLLHALDRGELISLLTP